MGGGMGSCSSRDLVGSALPHDNDAASSNNGGSKQDVTSIKAVPPMAVLSSRTRDPSVTKQQQQPKDPEHHSLVEKADSKTAIQRAESQKKRIWVLGQTVDIKTVYDFGKVLGKGQFGTTRLVVDRATGVKLACKSISKRKLTTQDDIEDVRREVQIMYHLAGHANVVRLRAAFEDRQYVHLVMDVCSGGELFDRIIERGFYTELQASATFHTMVSVIAHCHSMGVIHRDLKPENFLLSDKTDSAVLLATDFGLSVFFKEGQVFRDIVGSAYYVAPEVLRKRYSKEADIWSLGVLLYILLCGVPPFYGETEQAIFEEVMAGKLDFYSEPWPKISDPAKDCVRRMLVRDPRKRATAAEILNHAWVKTDGVAKATPLQSEVLNRLTGFAAMNKLKKEALKVIAANLPENEITGLREMFLSMDADQSGTITVEELREGLKKKGTKIPDADLARILHDVNVLGDGTIDYEEFLAATIHQSKLEQEENLFTAFKFFDKDGSGFITRDELVAALGPGGVGQDVGDIDVLIASIDKNGDGEIDYEEFCDMMRAHNDIILRAAKTVKNGMVFSQKSSAALQARHWDDEEEDELDDSQLKL